MLYGQFPMLAAKKYFEQAEQYETCQIITEVMADYYSWEKNSPTDIDQLTDEDYQHWFWRLGLPGFIAKANLYCYADQIINSLQSLTNNEK